MSRCGQRQLRAFAGSTRALSPEAFRKAAKRLTAAGAHYVIDSVADLLPVVDLIEGRLARGERPACGVRLRRRAA